jgi:tetratricopeptide (TPR) repeat protein
VLKATEAALALNPNHVPSILLRGETLVGEGRAEEGLSLYRAAIAAEPQNPAAHHALGALALERGRTQAALELLREARRLDPIASNDVAAIALAYGRLTPPFRALDPWIFRAHFRQPKIRWLIVVLLAAAMFVRIKIIGLKDRPPWDIHPGWALFCLIAANLLVLPYTFDMAARSTATMVARRELDVDRRQILLQPLVLARILWIQGMACLLALLAICSPWLGLLACAITLCLPLITTVVRTGLAHLGFYAGIVALLVTAFSGASGMLAALESHRMDDRVISLVCLVFFLGVTFFADDFQRTAVRMRIRRR